MRHSTRHLFNISMGWLLVWTALVAVPPQALAGSRAGYDIGRWPSQASPSPAPVKADMVTACQSQHRAMSTIIDALGARVQAAQVTNDPAQMRAALSEVQQQQAALKEHMARCNMMGMMPSMHGGMGGS